MSPVRFVPSTLKGTKWREGTGAVTSPGLCSEDSPHGGSAPGLAQCDPNGPAPPPETRPAGPPDTCRLVP